MVHRLRRYDVFRFAQNDVAPLRFAMMRCLPLCALRRTSSGEAAIIGKANIICQRQTSLTDIRHQQTKKQPCWVARVFARGEDSRALRLPSELAELRAANANRFSCASRAKTRSEARVTPPTNKKASHMGCFVLWNVLTKKMPKSNNYILPSFPTV